jgi:hypothetical protein
MRQERGEQQKAEEGQVQQQGGMGPEQDDDQSRMGRKPGMERDRDYDPDGDRMDRKR